MSERRATACGACGSRRGVAMVLVLITIVLATVLTAAVVTARRTTGPIGANAASSAAASWQARSAVNYTAGALAAMDLEEMLANSVRAGEAVLAMEIDGVSVEVTLTRLDGTPPEPGDRYLLATAVATIDGMERTITKRVVAPADAELSDSVDPYLREFAVYATEELTVEDGAEVSPWSASPERSSGRPGKMGVGFTSSGDFWVGSGARLVNVSIFVTEGASSGLAGAAAAAASVSSWRMPLGPLALASAPPAALATNAASATTTVVTETLGALALVTLGADDGGSDPTPDADAATPTTLGGPADPVTIPTGPTAVIVSTGSLEHSGTAQKKKWAGGGAFVGLELDDGATAELGGGDYTFENIYLRDRSTLVVRGRVRVLVEDVMIDESRVLLADGSSSLELYLADEFRADRGSVLGALVRDDPWSASGVVSYVRPDRVMLHDVPARLGGASPTRFDIKNGSVLLGSINAPEAEKVWLRDGSVLIGRATASRFFMESGSKLWYDPALDPGVGFSEQDSPLYTSGDDVLRGVEEALALHRGTPAEDWEALADALLDALQLDTGPSGGGASGDLLDGVTTTSGSTVGEIDQ